jgi:hypothetical protein
LRDFHKATMSTDHETSDSHSDPHTTRRANLLLLLREFTEAQLALGIPAKGIEQSFAQHLGLSTSRLSQFKSSRNLSDKVARQIETLVDKPQGWLDTAQSPQQSTPAEEVFVAAARAAWRATNAKGRRQLMRLADGQFLK